MTKISRVFFGFLIFTVSIITAGCDIGQRCAGPADVLLTTESKPTAALLSVLQKLEIHNDGTLASIVEQTQKSWLRPAGVERFQMSDAHASRLEELRPLFKSLGLVDTVYPTHKQYDYALVHGANLIATRGRIALLAKLWLNGVRFNKLVFLTGARTLDAKQEPVAALEDRTQTILPIRSDWHYDQTMVYKTETDMTNLVYDQAQLPAELRAVPVLFVDAPQTVAADGTIKRPTTVDTLVTWLKDKPAPVMCLFISNQPFVGYQDSITRTVLPATFMIETVGFAIPAPYESVSLYLDSLARWLYQEQQRRGK